MSLLVVSLGTTRGLQVADAALVAQLRAAGAEAEAVRVGIGAAGRLRRGYPANDVVEGVAARRAVAATLERESPRAVIFSTVTAALLAPRLEVPYAVRLDSPAALNRPGTRNALVRRLERRALAGARLVLPWSEAARAALPEGAAEAVVLPPPVEPSRASDGERERVAVAYVPDPKAKGLSLLCEAWSEAAVEGATLAIYGLDPAVGHRHLERYGVAEPDRVDWRGHVPATEFRAALRRATAFVQSALWEDFGQAPLEALADGALLATAPSGGAYEALSVARELDASLVAGALEPGPLAGAIRSAFALEPDAAAKYRAKALYLLASYGNEGIVRTLRSEVLPALLR